MFWVDSWGHRLLTYILEPWFLYTPSQCLTLHPNPWLCSNVWWDWTQRKAFFEHVSRLVFRAGKQMASTVILLQSTQSQKWWYLKLICLVHGWILGMVAISSAPLLSSKMQQCTLGLVLPSLQLSLLSSLGISNRNGCLESHRKTIKLAFSGT